jgi:putative ABC transport system permease protein
LAAAVGGGAARASPTLAGKPQWKPMKFFLLIVKNLRRNKLRSTLTCLAVMVLVFVVTMIWTVVYFLEDFKQEKTGNLKAIVTERWQMNSQMPLGYESDLANGAASSKGDKEPTDSMTWQFYRGTIDPAKTRREDVVAMVAMDVTKLPHTIRRGDQLITVRGMVDDLDPLDGEIIEKLKQTRIGCVMGQKRLQTINKRVGERFKLTSFDYTGIELEFEVVGVLPGGRWDELGFMNKEYLNNAIDAYKGPGGSKHPLAERRLNMVWLEVGAREDFNQVVEQVNHSTKFTDPPVKCETFASLIANYLDSYSSFIWFIEWVLVPGSMFSMVLLIANAISLNVRERTKELAVLKVLGYQPWQLLVLVLGEAVLLGVATGTITGSLIYFGANALAGGIQMPGAGQPFPVPILAIVWGAGIGGGTALLGSILPALTARGVRAAEVFARIA